MAGPPELQEEDADLSTPPSLEMLRTTVAPILPSGASISDLRWSSYYRISHRIVSRYSSGRCFLVGDAAHIHPPIGGQGMNTGIQDAHNLAWKLALAVGGRAAPICSRATAKSVCLTPRGRARVRARWPRTDTCRVRRGRLPLRAAAHLVYSQRPFGSRPSLATPRRPPL